MLLTETQTIQQSNLCQSFRGILSNIDKPADSRITLRACRMGPTHSNDCESQPSCVFGMHVLPPADLDGMTFCIRSLPRFIWIRLRGRLIQFEFGSILAGLSGCACVGWSWSIKHLVALESDQSIDGQSAELTPQPEAHIAPIK